jgi:chemotaxis protein histidine kinase CheA
MATLKFIKRYSVLFLTLLISLNLYGQEEPKVAEEIIKGNRIQFINRTNQRALDITIQRQINAGKKLAEDVLKQKEGEEINIIAKRFFDPNQEKYGADVIILTEKTNFGHINGIQRILLGYLQTAFQYNNKQAETLAELLVYYNANLRLNPKNIEESYSKKVLDNIDIKKAGIDRVYRNWPGKTQLLIPLRKNIVRPEKTDLDRKELQEVIEKDKSIPQEKKEELKKIDQELKKEDTKKIEQKEVELTKKEEEIKKTQEQIKQEEQKIQKELQDTNKKLEELRKDPEKNKEQIKQEEKKVEQLQEQKKEIEQQKQEVQQEQKKVEEAKQEIKEQKEQPQTTRKEEEKKENQATTENQQKQPTSKVDQQLEALKKENEELKKEIEKKEQQSDNVINEKIVFLKVMRYVSDGHYSNELWMVDPNKDDTLFRGPFTNICSRTFLPIENVGIVVIGYEDAAHTQTPHHLYLLDQDNLQVKAKSKEIVIFSSFLIYKDNLIYAIEELDGKYYLSRFNDKLELQDRSSSNINPHSEITFFKDKIYLTGSGTDSNIPIQIYNRKDLKLIKVIQPQKTSANK